MKVSRYSLIFGLSYALDIAGKNNLSHSKSTAYLSVMIGREMGMGEEDLLALYYAALLHDIGVSNEYQMNQHCVIGAEMLKKLPLPDGIPVYVRCHHEYEDGSGLFGLSGDETPRCSRIISFASCFDDMFGRNEEIFDRKLYLAVGEWLQSNRNLFSTEIIEVFKRLIMRESFLLDYFNQETRYTLSHKLTVKDDIVYGYEDILKFALCFADIIDRRSPFTYSHSKGIADLARKAAAHLGYDSECQNQVYIAGLLHDIGKLYVSTDILHKNGGLTPEERFEINKHAYYTRKVLEQIEGFSEVTAYASNHHEKMDGTGYPNRIKGDELSQLERVIAVCDVYQSLMERRPYREGLPDAKVWSIIDNMAEQHHLDANIVTELKKLLYK